jgi:hypothetical protein
MTTYFRTAAETNIGTTPVDVLTTNPANIYTIIGLNLANTTDYDVIVDVTITDAVPRTAFYIKQLIIPPYTSAKLVQQGEKIILGNSCKLTITSDTASSIDAVASYAEIA